MVGHPRAPAVIHLYPTLLCIPCKATGRRDEHVLPGQPADYSVAELPQGFFTVRDQRGQWLYFGAGPVELIQSPAPF